jgi:hypothetical protein
MKLFRYTAFLCVVAALITGCTKDPMTQPLPPTANAGPSQVIQLPVNTTSVTGTGTTTNKSITGYLWSLVSGPNVPVINSPSSPTTTINNLIAGTYYFQFLVIDDAGLTGTDTMAIVVKPIVVQTITLQPTNNANEGHVDTYTNTGGTTDTEIPIGAWTANGSPLNWREFIKFDFSQIPSNATILSATLYLYAMPNPHGGDMVNAHSGSANGFYIERILSNWNFTVMNWANQPASTTTNSVTVGQSSSATQDNIIDVSPLVRDMMINGNYGFKFRLQSEVIYNVRQYASSYNSNASLHPKLVITYQ